MSRRQCLSSLAAHLQSVMMGLQGYSVFQGEVEIGIFEGRFRAHDRLPVRGLGLGGIVLGGPPGVARREARFVVGRLPWRVA